jgi:hypothetical protein
MKIQRLAIALSPRRKAQALGFLTTLTVVFKFRSLSCGFGLLRPIIINFYMDFAWKAT